MLQYPQSDFMNTTFPWQQTYLEAVLKPTIRDSRNG